MSDARHEDGLTPALSELESALSGLSPSGAGDGENARRDELLFALGRAAGRRSARRRQVATAVTALLVGALLMLPWRLGADDGANNDGLPGRVVSDAGGDGNVNRSIGEGSASPPAGLRGDRDNGDDADGDGRRDSLTVATSPRWSVGRAFASLIGEEAHADGRADAPPASYVALRQRVLEEGLDALPAASASRRDASGLNDVSRLRPPVDEAQPFSTLFNLGDRS